jgi:PAS domain S-box-containing protein
MTVPGPTPSRAPGVQRSAGDEDRFRLLLESIDAVVWEIDLATGRASYVSPRFEELLGYPPERWLSDPDFWAERMVHPDDRAVVVPLRAAALADGEDHELNYRALTAGGRTVWLRDLARVVPAGEGEAASVSGVIVDVTARKEAERVAAEVVRRHEALLESAGEGIYGLDSDGNTTFANPTATRILGWSAEELVGRPQHDVIHHHRPDGSVYPREECPIHTTLRDGKVHRVEDEVFWRHDGSCVPVAYTSTPIFETGEVVGAVVTFRDVSPERARERALRESQEQLLEAQRLAQLGSWEWDVEGDVVTWSDELYRIFGLDGDTEERSYAAYLARVHPDDRERVDAAIREANRDAGPFDFEDRIIRPDGSMRALRTRGRAIANREGRTVRLVGTCQDITDQKAAAARDLELAREHEARLRAEEERQRNAFLAEAGALLSSSLDYERTLAHLAYLAVPRIADWCVVDLVVDGATRRLVTAHPDPVKEELARELGREFAPDPQGDNPVARVIRSGKPEVISDASEELLDAISSSPEHGRILRELQLRSYMVVPLMARGTVLGAFTFVAADSGRRFTETDLPFVRELVDRAALAVDNARLYRRAEESRAQVTRVLESITDAFFAVDAEWCFTYVNRQAEDLLQRPRAALLGKELWKEFPEALDSIFESSYRRATEEQRTVQFEAFFQPLNGWFEVRAYPAGGQGLSVYFRDIGERRVAQQALLHSEQRFRSLIEASAAIVWTTGATGEVETPQPEWSAFTGQGWEELRGWGWLEAVHPDDREATRDIWVRAVDRQSSATLEHRLRRHDGEYRVMQARAVPVTEGGTIREWVGAHTDITAQKRAEEEREKALAVRTRFYAAMSHELRTPINAVLGYTDLILAGAYGELNEKQTGGIERTSRAARHLLELVNDVLDLSKLEAGKLEVELEAVEMPALIEDLFATVRPLAEARGSELVLDGEGWRRAIATDPRRVRQILLNLLSNAIKFGGGHPVRVIARQADDGGAVVEVIDRGDGIAPENLGRIFEEFVQVGEEKGGTGLGLPISKRFAELLGGRLEVESALGEGSTFRLVLPKSAE